MTGKFFILLGIAFILLGLLFNAGMLSWFGKLPGDIAIKKDSYSFYFPVTTCIVLSLLLTFLVWMFKR